MARGGPEAKSNRRLKQSVRWIDNHAISGFSAEMQAAVCAYSNLEWPNYLPALSQWQKKALKCIIFV